MGFENISMNVTLQTLAEIDLLSKDQDKELLSVETQGGKTFLTATKQSALSVLGKKWTWLGFGNTSLKQVSHFLNSAEGRKQLEELEKIGDLKLAQIVIENVKAINEKIEDIEKPRRKLLQPTFIRVIKIRFCQLIRYLMNESVQIPLSLLDHLEKISLRIEKAALEKQLQEKSKLEEDYEAQLEELEDLLEEKEKKMQGLSLEGKGKSIETEIEAKLEKLRKQEELLKKQREEFAKYRMDTEEEIEQAKAQLQEKVEESQQALEKKQVLLFKLEKRQKELEEKEFALAKQFLILENEREEMAQLRHSLKTIEKEKTALESASKTIEQQLKDLRSKAIEEESQQKQKEKEIARLQSLLDQKAKELTQLQQKHQSLVKEKEAMALKKQSEIDDLEVELESLQKQWHSCRQDYLNTSYELSSVQTQLRQLKLTCTQKEAACRKALEEKEKVERALRDYQQSAQGIDSEKIKQLTDEYQQMKRLVSDQEKELVLAKQQLTQMEKQWQTVYAEGKKKDSLLEAKGKEITSAHQKLLDMQNQLLFLEQQRKELLQQNTLTTSEKQKLEKQLQESQSKSKLVEDQLAKSQLALAKLEEEKKKAEQSWRDWYQIAQDKEKILKQKEAECSQHAITLNQLKEKSAQEQSKLIGEKLAELEAKQEKEIKEHEEQLAALQKQKQHAEKQWKICYDTAEKMRADLTKLQQECLNEKQKNQQILQEQSQIKQSLLELQSQLKSISASAREKELNHEKEELLKEKSILAKQLIQAQSQVEELTQAKQHSQQNLDDHLRELISRQLSLPKGKELNQVVDATRQILETAMVEALKDGKGQLKLADFQQLEHLAGVAREQANLVAIQDFFVNLEKDSSIAASVKQLLKDEWNKGNGGIFGKEVKTNLEFFSSSKRTAILNKAKEWSQTKANLQQSLEQFQKQLDADIALGKFLPVATQQVRQRYGNYFALSKQLQADMPKEAHQQLEMELQKEFQKICNAALINREIQRKGTEREVGSVVEDLVLEQLGYSDVKTDTLRAKRKQAELDVLKILLQGKGMEETPIENLQSVLKKEERKARLQTVLNVKDQTKLKQVQHLIEILEREFLEACKMNEEKSKSSIDKEIDESLPTQAKGYFLRSKAQIVDTVNQMALEEILVEQKEAIRRLIDKNPKHIEDAIQLLVAELCGQMYSGELYEAAVEKILGKQIAFYKNWMDNLVSMVQGDDDPNKVLGKGTCFAISTQLALKEQNGDFDSVKLGGKEEDYAAEVGDVNALHRFRQALLGVSWKQADKPQGDATSALFGPTVSKALKIKGATTAFILNDPNLVLGDFEKALKAHAADLASTKGVGVITFWMKNGGAHAIYVRYDKVNKIYRLFDPNVGGITFKSESQLFYCFNDLMNTFYGDLTKLYCHRMDK